MTIYVFQVCFGILLSWIAYKLFLRGKASATTNRAFLILGLILPFIVPFIPIKESISLAMNPLTLPLVNVADLNVLPITGLENFNWMLIAYTIGSIGFVLFQINGVLVFVKLKKNGN